ncbi:MAG: nitronate monooxygenase [Pseudomonadota bacterium]
MDILSLLQYPIIQGPMAGGASTAALAAAVSNAGGLGSVAGSLIAPQGLVELAGQLRALSERPFLMNFFVQKTPSPSGTELVEAVQLLRPVWESLGWDDLPIPKQWCMPFEAQFETLLALRPAVASFTFDILTAAQVARLHDAGIGVIGTVTSVEEGLAWQAIGADAVVASGIEAGGHRGTFIGRQEAATLAARALWRQAAQALSIPVIAAGGIMDGADIRAALDLGAKAVQMGTAFLVCDESGIHPAYKARLLSAGDAPTRLTRAFSGRYARGLVNRFMQEMQNVEDRVPAYPIQNALTGSIRAAAAATGDTELMSLWAGTGVGRARAMPAAQLVQTLVAEMRAT